MPQTYEKPDLGSGEKVFNLVSADLKAQELTPKTRVTCINRGREVYTDKYDGRDYVVPPGLFEVEYEAANHFRIRSVVPGSRDPISGAQETFIKILGLDRPEECVPFTDEECRKYHLAVEALDRGLIEQEQGGKGTVVETQRMRARTAGQVQSRRRDVAVERNASHEGAPEAVEKTVGGDAKRAGEGEEYEQ